MCCFFKPKKKQEPTIVTENPINRSPRWYRESRPIPIPRPKAENDIIQTPPGI